MKRSGGHQSPLVFRQHRELFADSVDETSQGW